MARKKAMHVELTARSHDGWFYVSRDHRATMTALAEVIGLELDEMQGVPFTELPHQWRARLMKARMIEENNRSAQGKRAAK